MPYVDGAVSTGHLISQRHLIPFEQSVPQRTFNFSNKNHRSDCSTVPSHMNIYFELVNTKYFTFKFKLTLFSLLQEKSTDWWRFKLGAYTGIST